MHLNPVKTALGRRLDRRARLRLLDDYRWSSYRGYADGKNAEEFVTYDVLHEFARNTAAARRLYRAFVEQCLLDDDAAMLKLMNAGRYAIGDDRFVERTEASIEHRRTGSDADRDLALPRRVLSIDAIDEAVTRHFQVAREDWRGTGEAPVQRKSWPLSWLVGSRSYRSARSGNITEASVPRRSARSTARSARVAMTWNSR